MIDVTFTPPGTKHPVPLTSCKVLWMHTEGTWRGVGSKGGSKQIKKTPHTLLGPTYWRWKTDCLQYMRRKNCLFFIVLCSRNNVPEATPRMRWRTRTGLCQSPASDQCSQWCDPQAKHIYRQSYWPLRIQHYSTIGIFIHDSASSYKETTYCSISSDRTGIIALKGGFQFLT